MRRRAPSGQLLFVGLLAGSSPIAAQSTEFEGLVEVGRLEGLAMGMALEHEVTAVTSVTGDAITAAALPSFAYERGSQHRWLIVVDACNGTCTISLEVQQPNGTIARFDDRLELTRHGTVTMARLTGTQGAPWTGITRAYVRSSSGHLTYLALFSR